MLKTGVLAALVVMASFLLGFARDLAIADQFGTSAQAEFIFLALLIPAIVENIFGISVRDALIPSLDAAQSQDRDLARHVASRVGWPLLLGAGMLAALIVLRPENVIQLLVPGWDAERVDAASGAFQIGALVILVSVWSYFLSALLHLRGRFVLPLWRSVVMNVGALLAMWLWNPTAVGVLSGIALSLVLHLLWMQLSLRQDGLLTRQTAKGPRPFAGFFIPLLLATVAMQVNVLGERFFASFLEEGAIAQLSYAYRLATIPLTLFSLSVLSIVFTRLTQAHGRGDIEATRNQTGIALSLTFFLMVPSAVFMAAWAEEIVRILFLRGAFTQSDVIVTAGMLWAYCPGVLFLALGLLLSRISLSLGKTRPIVVAGGASVVATLALDALLIGPLGGQGLALAMSAGALTNALLLLYLLPLGQEGLGARFMLWSVCGAGIFGLSSLWPAAGVTGMVQSGMLTALIALGAGYLDPSLRAEIGRMREASGR